jgi:hypothetical protein
MFTANPTFGGYPPFFGTFAKGVKEKMKAHFVNSIIGEGERGEKGTSLAVMQFVELVRGERIRMEPQCFHVVEVIVQEFYCLQCLTPRRHDVARNSIRKAVWFRCRVCGKERE